MGSNPSTGEAVDLEIIIACFNSLPGSVVRKGLHPFHYVGNCEAKKM